jgi:hypothetical protein
VSFAFETGIGRGFGKGRGSRGRGGEFEPKTGLDMLDCQTARTYRDGKGKEWKGRKRSAYGVQSPRKRI